MEHFSINNDTEKYKLDFWGDARFWCKGWGQLVFDSTGCCGTACIHPDEDWVGALGTGSKRFNQIYCYTLFYDDIVDWSDKRLKENIEPLDSNLEKLLKLNGVSYNMKKNFYGIKDSKKLTQIMKNQKKDFGFVAQEIKEVIPEVVFLDTTTNLYSVNYVKLIPIIVEAMKEQQTQIDELTKRLDALEKSNVSKKSASINTGNNEESLGKTAATLNQNIPNPFNKSTKIEMYIPTTVSCAVLYVYNMEGTQIASYPITNRQTTSIVIEGSTLDAGMYLYTLIADGNIVDSKKMVLTR